MAVARLLRPVLALPVVLVLGACGGGEDEALAAPVSVAKML